MTRQSDTSFDNKDRILWLQQQNPDFEIYWSVVSKWAGKDLQVDSRLGNPENYRVKSIT